MRRSRRKNALEAGFSLIELIVVLGIMAALVGAVMPSINIGGSKNALREETLRLAELMQRASDAATFKTIELGVRFSDGDYRFMQLEGDSREGKWVVVEDDQTFRKRELPEELSIELEITGVAATLEPMDDVKIDEKTRPHVMFLSNGEILPDFRMTLEKGTLDERWQLATGVEESLEFGPVDE